MSSFGQGVSDAKGWWEPFLEPAFAPIEFSEAAQISTAHPLGSDKSPIPCFEQVMTMYGQIEANRHIARKKLGPKTPGSKATSSRNATRQGILSNRLNPEHLFDELDNDSAAGDQGRSATERSARGSTRVLQRPLYAGGCDEGPIQAGHRRNYAGARLETANVLARHLEKVEHSAWALSSSEQSSARYRSNTSKMLVDRILVRRHLRHGQGRRALDRNSIELHAPNACTTEKIILKS